MTSIQPIIVWCATSRHYVVENNLQYTFTVFLGIQLAKQIRTTMGPYPKNFVRKWYESLETVEKAEVSVKQLN